jgi:hypothetical protein
MPRTLRAALALLLLFAAALLLPAISAQAATAAQPPLASSTLLPTAQITGIAWATTLPPGSDTAYATGRFAKARPAGILPGGAGEVSRGNLVAFSASTGKLTSFNHTLNAQGRALASSPDGSVLYVGGDFTAVDGKPRSHLAAFDLRTGGLLPYFSNTGPSGAVLALTVSTSGTVYAGGTFSKASTSARRNVAAYTPGGALTSFSAQPNGQVRALALTLDGGKLVLGGSFSSLSGTPAYGLGAVSATSGNPSTAWAATREAFPIRADDTVSSSRAITSLQTDPATGAVYGGGFNYGNLGTPYIWEGTFAVQPQDGQLLWANNCHGDTYSVFPVRGILYSASHAHDCTAVNAYPETTPRTYHRLNASTTTADQTNVCGAEPAAYGCYTGLPASTMLTAFAPALNTGTYSGAFQGDWALTGNSNVLISVGEFTKVNGILQQGLARFAIPQ